MLKLEEREMIKSRFLVIAITISFLLAAVTVNTSKASPGVTLVMDPPLVIGTAVGASFDVYVTAMGATNLFLGEFSMDFDPTVLNVAAINLGDVAPALDFFYINMWDNVTGSLDIVVGRPPLVKIGLSGNVQCAKITFTVMSEASSATYLYDIRLKDVTGSDLVIDEIVDGLYASDGNPHYAYSSDASGMPKNVFAVGETIYVVGGGFSANRFVDIYLVPNATWTDGDPIGISVLPVVTVETVQNPGAPHLRSGLPITALGKPPNDSYDIVVDFDQDGVYDAATDGMDDVTQWPGFTGGRALRGDIDSNGNVGSSDFSILAGAYGTSVGDPLYDARADIDSNGNVGSSDFSILAGEYGQSA